MSYDLQLFRAVPGETIKAALARLEAAVWANELDPGPIVPHLEQAKHRLAGALLRDVPSLKSFTFDHQQIAATENVDEAEARRKWRHVEVREDGFGLQITFEDESASAALPYWHDGKEAQAALRLMWKCLEVLQKEAKYITYDPQLDRVLDLSSGSDFSAMLARYSSVKQAAEKAICGDAPKRPWWKFF